MLLAKFNRRRYPLPMPFDTATIKADGAEAVIRFSTADGELGPTLHIKATAHGSDRFELWGVGGQLIGDHTEFTLLGLLNAAVHGAHVL